MKKWDFNESTYSNILNYVIEETLFLSKSKTFEEYKVRNDELHKILEWVKKETQGDNQNE